ncbi:hypothetical protein PS631_00224 [Pseudomonas fluorescens]|uniref:Uncharacterized protein n=1 Tax=Pseudomonas fluorescens TaxID=294 RepID=A0A5E6PB01_PSEFL|nr:hypothetical protein [Pseudomonas fluorescens]VVM39890.1 hypothetical protein PS631_00224 [Pseudomonas fluorescens]
MKTKRGLQREILERLQSAYPGTDDRVLGIDGEGQTLANLTYLKEHGLVHFDSIQYLDGSRKTYNIVITARGIDFLEDDGGLGAILGTVTVKLHEDTLRQLIEAKVQASNLPEEQKSGILKALREAPGETTKQLITRLVDLGMENAPKAIPLIQTLLQGGQP